LFCICVDRSQGDEFSAVILFGLGTATAPKLVIGTQFTIGGGKLGDGVVERPPTATRHSPVEVALGEMHGPPFWVTEGRHETNVDASVWDRLADGDVRV